MENTNIENEKSQIRKARKNFIALAIAYFLGVFNDNFYKQAICLMAVGIGKSEFQGNATVIFAIPFLIFAAPAGWCSDRYSKRSVVVWAKGLEIIAMSVGAYGIMYENWPCIFAMLFIMATQSTLVSPALNGAIPELYPKSYVTKANSIVKLVSTSAILIGIAFAGPMIERRSSSEVETPFFAESSISEPIVFVDSLKIKDDEISKLILAQLDPSIINMKKENEKSLMEVVIFQAELLFDKVKTLLGGSVSLYDPKEVLDKNVKIELQAKINQILKSGEIAKQIKIIEKKELLKELNNLIEKGKLPEKTKDSIDDIYLQIQSEKKSDLVKDVPFKSVFSISSVAKIKKAEQSPTAIDAGEFDFAETVISRKYLEKQYSAHLKLIETTKTGKMTIAIIISLVAFFGWIVSLGIPKLKPAGSNKSFPIWGPLDTIKVVFNIRKDYLLAWTFFGSMLFYSLANLIVLKINSLGVSQFHFSFMDTSLLVVALLCGICVGSLIAGKISTDKIWYKLLPPALLIMGVFLTLIYLTPSLSFAIQYYYLFAMLVLTGIGGGIFIIPSESFCQTRPEPSRKGEILSAHNFVDFAGILASGFIFYVLEAMFPKHSNCMAFLGIIIIILSLVFFIAFKNVSEKEKNRESVL